MKLSDDKFSSSLNRITTQCFKRIKCHLKVRLYENKNKKFIYDHDYKLYLLYIFLYKLIQNFVYGEVL